MATNSDIPIDPAVAADERVQEALADLYIYALNETKRLLYHGTPQFKMAILRAFIPAMVKEMAPKQDDELTVLRRELEILKGEIMGGIDQAIEQVNPLNATQVNINIESPFPTVKADEPQTSYQPAINSGQTWPINPVD